MRVELKVEIGDVMYLKSDYELLLPMTVEYLCDNCIVDNCDNVGVIYTDGLELKRDELSLAVLSF